MRTVFISLLFVFMSILMVGQSFDQGKIVRDQNICYGSAPQALSFSIPPSGGSASYSYRWQRSNDGIEWYDVEGTSGARNSYSPPVLGRTAYFRCRVTDASESSATTEPVTITVSADLIAPVLGAVPTIYSGTAPETLVQTTPPTGGFGNYSFRWQKSDNALSWSDIPSANTEQYSPEAMINDHWFRQWVIDADCGSTASNTVKISVNPITLYTSEEPVAFNYYLNGDFGTEFEALTDGFITGARLYSHLNEGGLHEIRFWQETETGFELVGDKIDWSFEPGLLGWRVTMFSNPFFIEAGGHYIISITNCSTCLEDEERRWALTVNFEPVASNQYIRYLSGMMTTQIGQAPNEEMEESNAFFRDVLFTPFSAGVAGNSDTICHNSIPSMFTESLAPSGGSGGYLYQWQSSFDSIDWTNIPEADMSEYQPPVLTTTTYYRRLVTSGAFTASSPAIRILVNSPFTLAQLQNDITIFENSSTNLKIDISGGTPPYTLEYSRNEEPQSIIQNYRSGSEVNTSLLDTGSYNYVLTSVTDALGCHPQSLGNGITVTVTGTAPATGNGNAVVFINSNGLYYGLFTLFVKPYLDWFGIPYDLYDVSSEESMPDLDGYSIIIMGHREVYSDNYPLDEIATAIYSGTGLFSFDPHLFDFESPFCEESVISLSMVSDTIISINPEHFITELHQPDIYHPTSDVIETHYPIVVPARDFNLDGSTVLATLGTDNNNTALLEIAQYGSGRIVKWNSYMWIEDDYLGPLYGMDDLIWRGVVWAARKPFVMQGLPPMITMRVDDVDDRSPNMKQLEWIDICNEYGLIPWIGLFVYPDEYANPAVFFPHLHDLAISGLITVSPHSFTLDDFLFYNFNGIQDPPFNVADSVRKAEAIFKAYNLPMSKYIIPHWYLIDSDALEAIRDMGVEFVGTKLKYDLVIGEEGEIGPGIYPDVALQNGPYRIEREIWGGPGTPLFYADSVNWEGIPFFLCLPEIGDDGGYEWYPNQLSTEDAIARGVRHLRRSLNSMTLPVLFTHENQLTMEADVWREIIEGVTSVVSSYNPEYKSMDDAITYVRAKTQLKVRSIHADDGLVSISVTGANDMETKCYLFDEENGNITYRLVTLPRVMNTTVPVTLCINE